MGKSANEFFHHQKGKEEVYTQMLIKKLLKASEGIYFSIWMLIFSLKRQKKYTELYMRREVPERFSKYLGCLEFLSFTIRSKYKN